MKCICGCTLVYIIRSCVHVAKIQYFIWTSGEHLNNEENPDSKTQQFGVPVFIQMLFKEYLETDASLTAKQLLIKLTLARNKNDKKAENDTERKYDFSKELLPKQEQVIYLFYSFLLLIN